MSIPVKTCAAVLRSLLLSLLCVLPVAAQTAACEQGEAPLSTAARAIVAVNAQIASGQTRSTTPVQVPQVVGGHSSVQRAGTNLLQSRASLLRDLMATHPEEVRSVMLPTTVAAGLLAEDAANAEYLEHEATLTGDLGAVEIDDFANGAGQRVYVLHGRSTASHVAVHPAAAVALSALLHTPVAMRGVQLGNDLLAEAASPSGLRNTAQAGLARAAAVPASNITLTCSTTGQQRTAVLMLQFPDNTPAFPGSYGTAAWWQEAITGSGASVNSLWSEMTGGSTYATVDVYGPLVLPQRYGCADYLAMRTAALSFASNSIDLSRYTRIVLGFPEPSCPFGGMADIGCNAADAVVPHPYSVVWMPIVTTYTASTRVWGSLAHELGHNLGLNHANTLDFGSISLGPIDFQATNPGTVGGVGATTATGAVTAIDTEYGDVFSVMGSPWSSGPGPYSAEHRARLLGWIPASGGGNGLGTVMAAGSYTIQPATTGTGIRALRILRDPASASWLWLEYRNGGTPLDAANLAAIPGEDVTRGAVVHYENGYGNHEKTYQLDMTPAAKGNVFADGALLPGTVWSDPYSPLSLKVDGITSAGLNVSVAYDAMCAKFSVDGASIAAAGSTGTVTVTAPPGCAWTASSNAAWMSLAGQTGGSGNGSFRWTAAANSGSSQRVTYLTVGRTSQRLLQLGSGASVVALSPANGTVSPGANTVLSLTVHDAGGLADLQRITLDATAAGAAACNVLAEFSPTGTLFLFLLDPISEQYTDGLVAGTAGSLNTAGCSLSGVGSSVAVNGSDITFALNLSFPANVPGVRALYATANSGTELPLGLLRVEASQTNPPGTGSPTVTATALTATPNSALPGAPVVLSVTVTPASGTAVPTGAAKLLDGAALLGAVALDGTGRGSLSVSNLAVGTHRITAVYGGDGSFAGSTSAVVTVTIAQVGTTVTVTPSATQVAIGSSATLSVSVGRATGNAAPTGTVTLRDGSVVVATAALSNAAANFPLSSLGAGTHAYTVSYSGDAIYLPSASQAVFVTAGKSTTALTLSGTPTLLAGAAATITITATAGAAGVLPTGTVSLQDGASSLGTVTMVQGTATLSAGTLATGTHLLTASYAGDGNFLGASAAPVTVNVVDFAMTGATGLTVKAGATNGNTVTATLSPSGNGFPFSIALACSGAPAGASCAVSPAQVTPGTASVPLVVTVTTSASSARFRAPAMQGRPFGRSGRLPLAAWLGLPLALLFPRRSRRIAPRLLVAFFAAVALSTGVIGCGAGVAKSSTAGSANPTTGPPAGSSVLTIQAVATANGATLTHTLTVPLQVN